MMQTEIHDISSPRSWKLNLSTPPIIEQCGIGVHGYWKHESYLLPELWCLHLYRYEADLKVDGVNYAIRPGSMSIVAPGVPIDYEYRGRSVHLYAHFRAGEPSSHDPAAMSDLPVIQDLGLRFAVINEQMEFMTAALASKYQAQATLWSILWQLSQASKKPDDIGDGHPAVVGAVKLIELGLSEELSVADLARSVGVSYSYLGRLFQAQYSTTVVEYIRNRRMARACHLLKQSTLPIKAIAASVGIPDLHLFNKSIRRATGQSPRALRA